MHSMNKTMVSTVFTGMKNVSNMKTMDHVSMAKAVDRLKKKLDADPLNKALRAEYELTLKELNG